MQRQKASVENSVGGSASNSTESEEIPSELEGGSKGNTLYQEWRKLPGGTGHTHKRSKKYPEAQEENRKRMR